MKQYLFLLGKSVALCQAELAWLLERRGQSASSFSDTLKKVTLPEEELIGLAETLGGTVKIAEIISENSLDPITDIVANLQKTDGKVNFTVFGLEDKGAHVSIKKALKQLGRPVRFIEGGSIYDTANALQSKYHEFWVIPHESKTIIAKAVWIQNIKTWAKKDFGRPYSDPRSGMLPPKVARMMLNLSLTKPGKHTIYDPFCGSGTILMETVSSGHTPLGSDISQKAVEDSRQNLAWYLAQSGYSFPINIFQQDAAHVSAQEVGQQVDAIVFEPYMGPPVIRPEKVGDIAKGLEKLYIGAIKNLGKLQTSGSHLVGIFPDLKAGNFVKKTSKFIDSCENFGYTLQAGPLEYSRPNASVVRQIFVLKKI